MRFKAYIQRRRITKTPAGDFVMDAKTDVDMPDVSSFRELESHLRHFHRACPEAIKAARVVWRGYERQRRQTA